MIFRVLAAVVGAFNAYLGLSMTLAPHKWYLTTPGVTMTGPFNPHFVIDVGLAFLVSGAAFLGYACRPQLRSVALGASGFPALHALFHLSNLLMGQMADLGIDAGLAIPAFLGLALVWPREGTL